MAGRCRKWMMTVLALLLGTGLCFADTPAAAEQTTVWNSLPEITVYMATDADYQLDKEKMRLYVDGTEAEMESAQTFRETGEGAAYFLLVDVSGSIRDEDFAVIKRALTTFTAGLTEQDRIVLIPFGETVYLDETVYTPDEEGLQEAIEALQPQDAYTQLYAAIDAAVGVTESDLGARLPERRVAMVFSDGLDETTGGLITRDEAVTRMNNIAVPLYAFAVGNSKDGKDALGLLARNVNGALTEIHAQDADDVMEAFGTLMDCTLVIRAKAKNSEEVGDLFTVRITRDQEEFLLKEDVRAHKTERSLNAFSVTLVRFVRTYWWIFAVAAIALIVCLALLWIRRNRGVVTVDGKVVYGSNVQRKYHIQAQAHNTKELTFDISVDGGATARQQISLVESVIVGRGSGCDVRFDDINMSRQHFSIELTEGKLYVQDLESTGGTYLNGIRVYARQPLSSGDMIHAGKSSIRVTWE